MSNLQDNQREADLNLAYLAGIIDGEGSITIKYNSKTDVYFPCVSVGMTELPALELMVKVFGLKLRTDLSSNRKSTRKRAMYRWETNDRTLIKTVLLALRPYLRVKAAQADLVLALIGNGPIRKGGRSRTSELEKSRRKDLSSQVKELNNGRAPATTKRENNREVEAIV